MARLKLKRLEISGFKSFPDPVSVDFAGGITAIVGPNGCGKSNLSEAITWLLGEQSAKSLRGTKMEDVIFAGSQKRKPLGMAEAHLQLDTDPGFEHSQDGEITIGRRVFRSGESRYRLNDKTVRMRDVRDVLMDTGLGIRAYSVIEQGKIGLVLSGKPQERRKLLEEAAGITRYKARKRIAEIKLEEALGNLTRLDDVVSEVERSLRSLKRQASAARRFKRQQEEYRRLLKIVLEARAATLLERLARLDERLAAAQNLDAGLTRDLTAADAELAQGREVADRMAEEVATLHQLQAELGATIEGRQEQIKGGRRTLGEIAERASQGRAVAERKEADLTRWAESAAELTERRQSLVEDVDDASDAVDQDAVKVAEADRALEEATRRVEELRRDLLERGNKVSQWARSRQQAEVEQEKGQYRKARLEREREEHRRETEQAAQKAAAGREAVATAGAKLEERQRELEQVAGDLEAALKKEAEAARDKREVEEELSGARQRRRILTELTEAYEERRARLQKALAEAGIDSPTFLAQELSAVEGWERSLDVFLTELADAVVVPQGDASRGTAALELAGSLTEAGAGAILLEPLRPEEIDPEALPAVDDPAALLSLAQALQLPEGLAAALPPGYLVETPEDAARLARRHPGVAFLSRGGLWARGGLVHVEARRTTPGLLERQRELSRLEERVPRLESDLTEAHDLLQERLRERTGLARRQNDLQTAVAQARQELAVGKARLEDFEARHKRLTAEAEEIADEGVEIDELLAKAAQQRAEAEAERSAAESAMTEVQNRFEHAESEVAATREQRQQVRTSSADRRGRLELLKERLTSHDREIARIEREMSEGRRQIESWGEEARRLVERKEELEATLAQAERELQQALEGREASQEDMLAAQERLDERRAANRELDSRLVDLRERRDAARSDLEGLRVDRAGLQQDGAHLAATYREEFLKPPVEARAAADGDESEEAAGAAGTEAPGTAEPRRPATLAERREAESRREEHTEAPEATTESEPTQHDEPTQDELALEPAPVVWTELFADLPEDAAVDDLPAREAELARTKATLDRLGPVNVLAVEEYAEQEERLEFLTTQRTDVADSVQRLKETIREINETSGERFQETFEVVNRNFGEIFERLFRGGEAEMRLLDDDDVLESGIEIVARPPGKRLQNLMLLSGGEKALTAVALLFALFRTKPSPFCILDEVDAPLDDVNCVRFVELLREMSDETQFLVVTHNKITMEAASTLYGVTMEEKGVSKLVAVEIDEVQPAPEAKTA